MLKMITASSSIDSLEPLELPQNYKEYFDLADKNNNCALKERGSRRHLNDELDSLSMPEIIEILFPPSFEYMRDGDGQTWEKVYRHTLNIFKDKEKSSFLYQRYFCPEDDYSDIYRRNIISILALSLHGFGGPMPKSMDLTPLQSEMINLIIDYALDAGIGLLEKDSSTARAPICYFLQNQQLPDNFFDYLLSLEPNLLSDTNDAEQPILKFCLNGSNLLNPTSLNWAVRNIPIVDIEKNLDYLSVIVKSSNSITSVPEPVKEKLKGAYQALFYRQERHKLNIAIDNPPKPSLVLGLPPAIKKI